MLGKLCKYELKATKRLFIPIYITLFICVLTNTFSFYTNFRWFQNLTHIIVACLFTALGVMTVIFTVRRFRDNLLKDEGYLMFTLPVTARKLILSKLIIGIFWFIMSTLIAIINVFILLFNQPDFDRFLQRLRQGFISLINNPDEMICFAISMAIVLLSYILFILALYGTFSLGQLSVFRKIGKKITGIICLVVFILVSQILSQIIYQVSQLDISITASLFITMCILGIAIVIIFEGIRYILNKHLNLE